MSREPQETPAISHSSLGASIRDPADAARHVIGLLDMGEEISPASIRQLARDVIETSSSFAQHHERLTGLIHENERLRLALHRVQHEAPDYIKRLLNV